MTTPDIAHDHALEDNLFASRSGFDRTQRVHYHVDDTFRYEDGEVVESERSIGISCIGHGRASRWENAMAERFRSQRMATTDKPTFKLHNLDTPVEIGDEWQTLYVSSSVAQYYIGAETPEKALSQADGGEFYRPLYLASFETRVLKSHPTGDEDAAKAAGDAPEPHCFDEHPDFIPYAWYPTFTTVEKLVEYVTGDVLAPIEEAAWPSPTI